MPIVPIDPGSVPEWVDASIAAYAFATSFRKRRLGDFYDQITKDPELAGDAIMEVLDSEDLFREIYERGAEAAVRSSKEAKRRLLGRVVAAALDGTGFARPDEAVVLIRTLDALEPLDLQLLVRLAQPIPGSTHFAGGQMEGYFTIEDIRQSWSDLDDTLEPTLAVLVREGLLQDVQGADGYRAYAPSGYGRRVLHFLAPDELGTLNLEAAALACRLEGNWRTDETLTLVIRNLGPGVARAVRVRATLDGSNVLGPASRTTFNLDPLMDHRLRFSGEIGSPLGRGVEVRLEWLDGRPEVNRYVDTLMVDI